MREDKEESIYRRSKRSRLQGEQTNFKELSEAAQIEDGDWPHGLRGRPPHLLDNEDRTHSPKDLPARLLERQWAQSRRKDTAGEALLIR